MDALDVISLQEAKDVLVVDYDDRDAEITQHIRTAIQWVENYTNVMLYERTVEYDIYRCNGIEINDYPITILTPNSKVVKKPMSIVVYNTTGKVDAIIGYGNKHIIPPPLIAACYKIITYLFENKDAYMMTLPLDIQGLINQYRRSATI